MFLQRYWIIHFIGIKNVKYEKMQNLRFKTKFLVYTKELLNCQESICEKYHCIYPVFILLYHGVTLSNRATQRK